MTHTDSWSENITSWHWSIHTNKSQHLKADWDRLFSPHYIRAAANDNVHHGLVWHNKSINITYYSSSLWKVKDSKKKKKCEYCVYVCLAASGHKKKIFEGKGVHITRKYFNPNQTCWSLQSYTQHEAVDLKTIKWATATSTCYLSNLPTLCCLQIFSEGKESYSDALEAYELQMVLMRTTWVRLQGRSRQTSSVELKSLKL